MNQRKLSIDLAKLGIFLLKRAWLLILCATKTAQTDIFAPKAEIMHNTILLLHNIAKYVKFYRFASTQTADAIRLAYETVNQRSVN